MWRASCANEVQNEYVEIHQKVSTVPGAEKFTASKSVGRSLLTVEECVAKLIDWQRFRLTWVYNEHPKIHAAPVLGRPLKEDLKMGGAPHQMLPNAVVGRLEETHA